MHYSRTRQRIMCQIGIQLCPVARLAVAATIEPLIDGSNRSIAKIRYHPRITAYAVVVVMPSKLGRQNRPPVANANDAYLSQPFLHLSTRFAELLGRCSAANQEPAFAAQAAVVSKTQKVERIGPAFVPQGVPTLILPETDRPGLLWVQAQAKFRKAFT